MISQDAGSILASMVMHNSGEPHTNAQTIMAEPELNDLRSPSVHVCSVAVDFATAHHRQTQKLANQNRQDATQESLLSALLLYTTIVRAPVSFPYKRKRVPRVVSKVNPFTSA